MAVKSKVLSVRGIVTRPTVRTLLKQREDTFTVSERRVVAVLLANYPSAALTSISQLAGQADVSDPTVHRLVLKLGFDGYPEFQRALLAEVDARMNSPLSLLESSAYEPHAEDVQQAMLGSCTVAIGRTAEQASREDFELAVSLLADPARTVFSCGGRASSFIASWFVVLLSQLRSHARHIEPSLERGSEALADLEAGDVHVSLLAPSASPFDTKVPVLAQTEAIVAALVQRLPDRAKARLKRIEALRAGRVAEDA
jgi:DNA-binding MurR/RpiR family transcriptional regulator